MSDKYGVDDFIMIYDYVVDEMYEEIMAKTMAEFKERNGYDMPPDVRGWVEVALENLQGDCKDCLLRGFEIYKDSI